jgi:hypothetical protein
MPRAFDRRQLSLTHDPSRRISEELPKTPKFGGPTQWSPKGDGLPIPIVQQVIDSIVQGFHGWFDQVDFNTENLSEFGNTVGQALGQISTIGIRLAKLEGTDTQIFENFEEYPGDIDSLGSKWFQWYAGSGGGTLGVVGKYATFTAALLTKNKWAYAIHKTPLSTHLHRVAVTVSVPQSLGGESANIIVARANPVANGDHVFARLERTSAQIGFVTAGMPTVLAQRDFTFRNGSVYSLDCTAERTFRLLENDTEILSGTDTAGVSVLGKSVGFGTFAPNNLPRPGVVGSFATYV